MQNKSITDFQVWLYIFKFTIYIRGHLFILNDPSQNIRGHLFTLGGLRPIMRGYFTDRPVWNCSLIFQKFLSTRSMFTPIDRVKVQFIWILLFSKIQLELNSRNVQKLSEFSYKPEYIMPWSHLDEQLLLKKSLNR